MDTKVASGEAKSTLGRSQALMKQLGKSVNSLAVEASYNELRSDLYSKFQSSGMIQSLKSQLRAQMLSQLRKAKAGSSQAVVAKGSALGQSVISRLLNSLIAEYLSKSGLRHTLSVFLPESGTNGNNSNTVDDLLQVLRLDGNSQAMSTPDQHIIDNLILLSGGSRTQSSSKAVSSSKSTLEAFFLAFASKPQPKPREVPTKTTDTQTTKNGTSRLEYDSVDYKLKMLEVKYQEQLDKERSKPFEAIDQRMSKYQRECDTRARKEVKEEVERIRATELAQIRIEERMRHRGELQVVQQQIEDMYRERMKEIQEKEDNMSSALNRKAQLVESTQYKARQRLLEDIERVRQREAQVKREAVHNSQRLQLELDKIAHKSEEMNKLMNDYKEKTRELDQTLRQTREQAKFETQREWEKKLEETLKARFGDMKTLKALETALEEERAKFHEELEIERQRCSILEQTLNGRNLEVKALVAQSKANHETLAAIEADRNELAKKVEEGNRLKETIRSIQNKAKQEVQKNENRIRELEEAQLRAESSASERQRQAQKRAANVILGHKRNFERQVKALHANVQTLKLRLGIKNRQALELDAQREADETATRAMRRQIQGLQAQLAHAQARAAAAGAGIGGEFSSGLPPLQPAATAAVGGINNYYGNTTELVVPLLANTGVHNQKMNFVSRAFQLDFSNRGEHGVTVEASNDVATTEVMMNGEREAELTAETRALEAKKNGFLQRSDDRRQQRGHGTWTANTDKIYRPASTYQRNSIKNYQMHSSKLRINEPVSSSSDEVPIQKSNQPSQLPPRPDALSMKLEKPVNNSQPTVSVLPTPSTYTHDSTKNTNTDTKSLLQSFVSETLPSVAVAQEDVAAPQNDMKTSTASTTSKFVATTPKRVPSPTILTSTSTTKTPTPSQRTTTQSAQIAETPPSQTRDKGYTSYSKSALPTTALGNYSAPPDKANQSLATNAAAAVTVERPKVSILREDEKTTKIESKSNTATAFTNDVANESLELEVSNASMDMGGDRDDDGEFEGGADDGNPFGFIDDLSTDDF